MGAARGEEEEEEEDARELGVHQGTSCSASGKQLSTYTPGLWRWSGVLYCLREGLSRVGSVVFGRGA